MTALSVFCNLLPLLHVLLLPWSSFSELPHCTGRAAGNPMLVHHGVSTQGVGTTSRQHILTTACGRSDGGGSARHGEQTWLAACGHHSLASRNPLEPVLASCSGTALNSELAFQEPMPVYYPVPSVLPSLSSFLNLIFFNF